MENFTSSQAENYMQAGKRLRLVRHNLGISQKELSERIGIKMQKLADMESGRVRVPVEVADFLYVNFSIDFRWLLTGNGQMEKNTEVKEAPPSQEQSDCCRIPMIGARGSYQPEGIEGYCLFRREWVKQIVSKPENAFLLTVTGNSMEPSIHSKDLVMIDTGRTSIYEGGLFALRMDDTIMAKRLSLRPGDRIMVISDNREYASYEAARKDIQVIAQVVWVARVLVDSL